MSGRENFSGFGGKLTRRDFLWLISAAGAAGLQGCATDPVTGKQVVVGLDPRQELAIDRSQSPFQFSSDYGESQDRDLNHYVDRIGGRIGAVSHRPAVPYSFRVVNANYINAYAFPGGSIAVTRGLLVELENEAELAALLGHEVGHVSARHAAEQAGKTVVTQAALIGGSVLASAANASLGDAVYGLGSTGAGALLSRYSRNNERESDALGLRYMADAGYNPNGMLGLTDVLRQQKKSKPGAVETLFATHPPGDERYDNTRRAIDSKYGAHTGLPLHRERFMDQTEELRRLGPAIRVQQEGEAYFARRAFARSEQSFRKALRLAPDDYPANLLLAKSLMAQERQHEAQVYLDRAKALYPDEAQAHNLSGINKISLREYDSAYGDLTRYDSLLPGNPGNTFLRGVAREGMQDRQGAAQHYYDYLQVVREGTAAQHAYARLRAWGYLN